MEFDQVGEFIVGFDSADVSRTHVGCRELMDT